MNLTPKQLIIGQDTQQKFGDISDLIEKRLDYLQEGWQKKPVQKEVAKIITDAVDTALGMSTESFCYKNRDIKFTSIVFDQLPTPPSSDGFYNDDCVETDAIEVFLAIQTWIDQKTCAQLINYNGSCRGD
jgi:hypothetical protein